MLCSPSRLERLSEKGTSNALIVDLAGIRRAKWTEKPLFGDPQGYAASASEAFRTVSEEVFSETEFPVRRLLGNSQTEGIEGDPTNEGRFISQRVPLAAR